MVLTRLACLRFFNLFDPLTVYANGSLDAVGYSELFEGGVRGIDEKAQAKVAYELWQNLDVIDDFCKDNPARLSYGELEIVRSWRNGLTGHFLVWRFPDGIIRFIADDYAFEVCGISKEIEEMLSKVPTTVKTTLLPFEGRILYSEYLMEMPMLYGANILKSFEESAQRIEMAHGFVSTAERLLCVAPVIRQRELERDMEQLRKDIAREERGDEMPPECHRGVLADITDYDERERMVLAHMHEQDRERVKPLLDLERLMEDRCQKGAFTTSLAELLARERREDMLAFARAFKRMSVDDLGFDLKEEPQLAEAFERLKREAEEAEETAGESFAIDESDIDLELFTDAELLQDYMGSLSEPAIEGVRTMVEHGGRMTASLEGRENLGGLPLDVRGVVYVFHEGDAYEFVVPDEVLPVARDIDWDAVKVEMFKRHDLVRFFDELCELRGIVELGDGLDGYKRAYPDGFQDYEEICEILEEEIGWDRCSSCILDTGEASYLLHYELLWEYREASGLDRYGESPIEEGELDELLAGLLARQEGKEPRYPTSEMLAYESLFQWKERQPCVATLRTFLDANVPDVRDDYYFADKVIEELIDEAKWGIGGADTATFVFEVLDRNDFTLIESQMQVLLNYWMNICNNLPVWPNNGWAPNELAVAGGQMSPAFFNEDGTPKKVGRNDPCPCGSGKKYKKCCGR